MRPPKTVYKTKSISKKSPKRESSSKKICTSTLKRRRRRKMITRSKPRSQKSNCLNSRPTSLKRGSLEYSFQI